MKVKINFLLILICLSSALISQPVKSPQDNEVYFPGDKWGEQNVFNGNETIATSYTRSACGLNYVQASNLLFGRTGNNFTGSLLQPATFAISGIPACAVIEKAFLYISTIGTGTALINANITNPASGNFIFSMALIGTGADKNWGRAGSHSFRADVTSVIAGNGNYIISGIPSSSVVTDDDGNGATLLIIYSDRTQNYTGSIVIADGHQTNVAGPISSSVSGFSVCATPSLSGTFMILDDLQQYGNTSLSLNNAAPNYTQLAASDKPWAFLADPGATLTVGQTTAQFGVANPADSLGLVMAGLYYQTGCLVCPVSLSLAAAATPSCLSTATVDVQGGFAPYTYGWSGSVQTTSIVTGLSAGVETITVTDLLGCLTGTTTVVVTTPAPPITITNGTACIGFSENLSAGAATSYSWSPSASINAPTAQNVIASPLATTIYTLDYVNALGCAGSQTTQVLITYTQSIGVTNTTLCAAQNLNLSANSFAGAAYFWTGPNAYSYSSTALPDPVIPNANTLMSGPYNLSVTSVPGCTSIAVSNVTVHPLPTPTVTSNGTICTGFNLNLNSSGGTLYNWAGPNGFSSTAQNTTIANSGTVASGVYSLTASFVTGCARTATLDALVRASPPASCAITSSNVCLGRTINFAATGGSIYQWNGPNGFNSNFQNPTIPAITLAANGVYTVMVTDAAGCQAAATTTLAALFNPTVALVCPVTCSGSVATITANGLGFYTFRGPNGFVDISPLIPVPGISTTTVIANALSAGIYTIELQSALNSCSAQATGVLATIPIPTIVATGSAVCLNAVATLTATGGLANGTGYSWIGPASYTSANQYAFVPVVNALTSGVYTVVGTAPNSCTSQAVTTLTTIPLPTVTATGTLICLNEPFTFTAGGAVTYTWSGPSTYTFIGANAFVPIVNNFSIGDYTVVGTALNTCTQVTTANLAYMPLPTITTLPDNVCLNEQAILQSGGGIAGGYGWRGPNNYTSAAQNATIVSATSVAPVIYTVVGTAANSCTNVSTALLTTIPLPTVVATGTVICYNEPYVIPSVGADVYSWTGPLSYTSNLQNALIPIVDSLSDGIYTVVGLNSITGCTNVTTAMISTMPLPTITALGTTVCYLTPAVLKANGGITNGYTWTGPGGYSSTFQNAYIPSANSAAPQTYTVVGTAPNSCTNVTTATLITLPLPVPTFTAPSRVCFRSNIDLKGGGASTYTWSGPYFYVSANRDVWFPTYNWEQAGTYTLGVTDSFGCRQDTTTFIEIDELPEGFLASNNKNNYCAPYCSKFWLNNQSTSPIVKTTWGIGMNAVVSETFDYCITKPGQEFVVGTFSNAVGCVSTQTLAIPGHPRPHADFHYLPLKPVESVDVVSFMNLSEGEKITKWDWFFSDRNGFTTGEKNPEYIFEDANMIRVAMVATNEWGCSDTAVKAINVKTDVKLHVPESFTPNGDGLNDIFLASGRGIAKFDMTIYEQWGKQIFRSTDLQYGWDGTIKGELCNSNIYVWRIIYTDINGRVSELVGHITVTR